MKTSAMIKLEKRAISLFIFVCMLAATLLVSCESDDDLNTDTQDSETAQLEATENVYDDDADDIAVSMMAKDDPAPGGKTAGEDDRLSCATITRTGDLNAGTITIDFGTGCTDKRGHVRKGQMIIEFQGRWFRPGSFWKLRFHEHFINNVAIEGTRTVTNVSESEDGLQAFTVVVENGKMTFPDGTTATRKVNKRRELERDDNNILKRLIIYGTAEGNHRNGRGFYIEILERLIYDRSCEDVIIPVSGKKLIKNGLREITIDYGNGECDNTVTITNKNGHSWTYTVTRD